jgi:hypothetical protein
MTKSPLEARLRQLEQRSKGDVAVHAIAAWTAAEFEAERARRVAAGQIGPRDIVVMLANF